MGRVANAEQRGRIKFECHPVLAGSGTLCRRTPDEAVGEIAGYGDLAGQLVKPVGECRIKQGLVYNRCIQRGAIELLDDEMGIARHDEGGGGRVGYAVGPLQLVRT